MGLYKECVGFGVEGFQSLRVGSLGGLGGLGVRLSRVDHLGFEKNRKWKTKTRNWDCIVVCRVLGSGVKSRHALSLLLVLHTVWG